MDDLQQPMQVPSVNKLTGLKRRKVIAWMLVVRQTILPMLVAVVTVVVFGRLGQAQEALIGAIGLASPPPNAVARPLP